MSSLIKTIRLHHETIQETHFIFPLLSGNFSRILDLLLPQRHRGRSLPTMYPSPRRQRHVLRTRPHQSPGRARFPGLHGRHLSGERTVPEHRAKGQHRRNDLHLLANSVHQRGLVDEWVSERLYRGGGICFLRSITRSIG